MGLWAGLLAGSYGLLGGKMSVFTSMVVSYIIARLKEPSTWRGLILMITSAGVTFSPDQINALVAVGLCAAGAVGAFVPDNKDGN